MAITEHSPALTPGDERRQRYVRPVQPIVFPCSEEAPETNRHLELRTALYQILKREFAENATIGSDQFVYYDPTNAQKRLAPNAFVKLGVPHTVFPLWKTWHKGAPDVAVEVVSDSDEPDEAWENKMERYRAAGIGEVVRFDPDDGERPVRVWDHIDGDLIEREPPEDGVFECLALKLFWVAAPHPTFVRMLRLSRDREGRDLLPTPNEAEQVEARARKEAEKERDRYAAEVAELRRLLAEQTGSKESAPTKAVKNQTSGKRARPTKAG